VALAPAARQPALEAFLSAQISKVMKIPAARLERDQALTALGIDSLTAVQLKNLVETSFGVEVSLVSFLQGPTISGLAALLSGQITALDEAAPNAPTLASAGTPDPIDPLRADAILATLDDLPDAEVERLLGQLSAEEEPIV
jgi:acyl carrier protein